MGVTWRKIWRDLARNKARTFLVVLATAVGVYSIGMVFGTSNMAKSHLTETHKAATMAHIRYWMRTPFDQDVVDAVLRDPEVVYAEGAMEGGFRWRFQGETEWREGDLVARANYETHRISRISLLEGEWPAERQLAVERLSWNYYGITPGMDIEIDNGARVRTLPVGGVIQGQIILPPQFGDRATFFVTPETWAWITGQPEDFNKLSIRLESFDLEKIRDIAQRIGRRLDRMGLVRTDEGYYITDPEVHWAQEQIDTTMFIMGVSGVVSLTLSGFLIVNTMNAIIVQQVWQVGVMKVFGATFWRVARIYLMTALVYGTLALLLGVPSGLAAAYMLAEWMLDLFNAPLNGFRIVPAALVMQIIVGLAVPLVAALIPVIGGARATVRQAMDTRGMGGKFGQGWLDGLIGRIRRLPRPFTLSLRNTFRRKARIALTLVTLVLGGAMFIVVVSVAGSMTHTLRSVMEDFGHDVMSTFYRPYRAGRLIEIAQEVDGVERAEAWSGQWASLSLPDDAVREAYLWGVPSDSEMFSPRIIKGRELLPGDGHAILLNSKIADEEDIQVGDEVELAIGGRESNWTVVGVVLNINNGQRQNFVPFDALAREAGTVGKSNVVIVTTKAHDFETQQRVGNDLNDAYTANRIKDVTVEGAEEVIDRNLSQFQVAINLMLAMAGLAAVVGSIGLASTMSINVIERAREIGVMRATGATSPTISGIFVGEGVLVGLLSWLLAVPLSYPSAMAFANAVGDTLLLVPLEFSYSTDGVFLWLGIVAVLSTLASLWPALRATRVSIREALAYE
ncbi:MAG: FtsX-like permease family protein [Chloroflexi bacterium]|nr:FtsX-like permease family protein [Chloroflexota bacterium]